jgi:5-methylcytosine-specific restriction enzyme subunit McrC
MGIDVYEHGFLPIDGKTFLRRHWEACAELNELNGDRYFIVRPNGLQFRHYVGALQVDNLTLHIHPKADKLTDDKRWQPVLLEMLEACDKLKAETADKAQLERSHLNLLEIYFAYYLDELDKLLRYGLVKRYRRETGNVKALKGKLDFAGQIRHNLVHGERFYTTHPAYDANHLLHQVLCCALEIVERFTKGGGLANRCKRIRLNFPDTNRILPSEQMLKALRTDRKTAPYERALELAKLLIRRHSPDISSGGEGMIALLFDMNRLWEEYVLVSLQRYVQAHRLPYSVSGQRQLPFWGSNRLQPDIVLTGPKGQTYIIDTKWKLPGTSPGVHDLRQMYAYARRWHAEKVMLLYPGTGRSVAYDRFLTKDYAHDDDGVESIEHWCKMAVVNVLGGDGKLNVNLGKLVLEMAVGMLPIESASELAQNKPVS